jgi:hypothetical protein
MEDYEVGRRERLAELLKADEAKADLPLERRYSPGTYGSHEALHASHMMLGLIERDLAEHPAILLQPEWYAHVRKAQDELFSLYQKIGAEHL